MRKKITIDVILSLLSSAIPIVIKQFIVLPLVAGQMSAQAHGKMISVYSLIILIAGSLGGALNNSRLIRQRTYLAQNITGDYNIMLTFSGLISAIAVFVGVILLIPLENSLDLTFVVFLTFIYVANAYLIVDFRLRLNYRSILANRILVAIGYLAGAYLFSLTRHWPLIYLVAYGMGLAHLLLKTNLLSEPFVRTIAFKPMVGQYTFLASSSLLVALGAYVDKLLLFPLLGGSAVAVYYVATMMGKTMAMVVEPIRSVMLSYFAQMDVLKKRDFHYLLFGTIGVGVIAYFAIIVLSPYLLSLLYPQYLIEAMKYVPITTATGCITVICNVVNSVLLKFRASRWQLIMQGAHMIVYLTLSLLLLSVYGLTGFCVGLLIASLVKLLLMLLVYYGTREALSDRRS